MAEAVAHELADLLLGVGGTPGPGGGFQHTPAWPEVTRPPGALQRQRRRGQGEERVEVGPDRLGAAEDGVEEAHVVRCDEPD